MYLYDLVPTYRILLFSSVSSECCQCLFRCVVPRVDQSIQARIFLCVQ